jgi:peptide/nickel transport system permease protein
MSQADNAVQTGKPINIPSKRGVNSWVSEERFIGKVWSNKKARYSFSLLLLLILIGIIGPWISPHDPTKPYYDTLLTGPSKEHLLGTDAIGRDVLSRLLYGTRVTIMVAVISVSITFITGTLIGLISAFMGGFIENFLMRMMDILLAIPNIIMAMAIVAVLGPSLTHAMIAVGIAGIPNFARLTRGASLSVKTSGYVEASHALGSSKSWIIFYQFLPNILSTLLVYTTLHIGIAILDTAGLSFIGLGAQPPTPEWGTMLSEGKEYIREAWWLSTFPGIAITVVVFTVNILGDALRDVFDPKSSQ